MANCSAFVDGLIIQTEKSFKHFFPSGVLELLSSLD